MSIYEQFTEHQLNILKARAERAASFADQQDQAAIMTALLVTIRGEAYALPIDSIMTIYNDIPVVPIPCVPPYVAGLANVRGHLLPVIDLAVLLGVPGSAEAESTALIVAANEEMTVAFRVEAIGDVEALALDKLSPVPAASAIGRAACLRGVLPDGTVLLDVAAILADPALIVDETVG
jgi:purine-binding chemotaxis protein CheW